MHAQRDPRGEVVVGHAERVRALAPHHRGEPFDLADRRLGVELVEERLVVHDDEHERPRANLGVDGPQQGLNVSFAGHLYERFRARYATSPRGIGSTRQWPPGSEASAVKPGA